MNLDFLTFYVTMGAALLLFGGSALSALWCLIVTYVTSERVEKQHIFTSLGWAEEPEGYVCLTLLLPFLLFGFSLVFFVVADAGYGMFLNMVFGAVALGCFSLAILKRVLDLKYKLDKHLQDKNAHK